MMSASSRWIGLAYVREEDGLVRYYLEGPPRDGELPYLQGQPLIGADGRLVVRDEVPGIVRSACAFCGRRPVRPANITCRNSPG